MKRPAAARRTILKVLAFLAAGATLNVAVAWGLALWSPVTEESISEMTVAGNPPWNSGGWLSVDSTRHPITVRSGPGTVMSELGDPLSEPPTGGCTFVESGWPVRSLHGEVEWIFTPTSSTLVPHRCVALPAVFGGTSRLGQFVPAAPLWPGFAINTVFYAGVLWMLFCGPFALRRMIRRRRGRCPHCAYPIGQSPVCTECGALHAHHRRSRRS